METTEIYLALRWASIFAMNALLRLWKVVRSFGGGNAGKHTEQSSACFVMVQDSECERFIASGDSKSAIKALSIFFKNRK